MFERMEIAEYIYEGVVENSYKIPTREDTNCYSHSRKKREFPTSSKTYSETNKSSVKLRKRYVDHLKYRPKLTCLIHGPGHSSYECKFLGDFGYKYSKSRPTKYCRQDPAKMKKCKRQKENNSISQHAVDQIILKEKSKFSAEDEAQESIYFEINEDDLHEIDNMSIDKKTENKE